MTNMSTAERGWIVPVLALLLATFAVCSAELVIAGLLPAVADDLAVSIPVAGLLITGYAIGVGVTGPILALLTAGVSRKVLLCAIMAVFVVGNVLCAIATSYWSLLGARLVLAACHGLHFGVVIVVASQLAPAHRQATAISLVIAGVSSATVIGVPFGTAIGNAYGWRAPFWVAAAIGVIACLVLFWLVPATGKQEGRKSNMQAELRAAGRPVAILCYAVFALMLAASFSMISYIVPFFTEAGGVPLDLVPWILLALGVAGFIGTLIGGWLGDRNPAATMIGALVLLTLSYLGLWLTASNPVISTTLLGVGWMTAFAVPGSLQARLMREVSDAPNFASTVMNTASQVGIAGGAALGGLVIASGWSYAQLPLLSTAFEVVALLATATLVFYDRRQKTVPAAA
jgi:DHA1 family inner membrane transport protein